MTLVTIICKTCNGNVIATLPFIPSFGAKNLKGIQELDYFLRRILLELCWARQKAYLDIAADVEPPAFGGRFSSRESEKDASFAETSLTKKRYCAYSRRHLPSQSSQPSRLGFEPPFRNSTIAAKWES